VKTTVDVERAIRRLDACFDDGAVTLERLVRIPSVSLAGSANDLERSATEVAAALAAAGADEVEVCPIDGGAPAVFAHSGLDARPTVLLYAHYDVQPAGDLTRWESAPFEPDRRQGRLYGRGAADNKAAIVMHACALHCLQSGGPKLKIIVEGEEEVGSPNLAKLLERYGERLRADVVVIADSVNWRLGVPAVTTSLRGMVSCYVQVETLREPVHSGLYGGAVPDALTTLVRLLNSLHDDAGDVAIGGLASNERASVDLSDNELRESAGVLDGVRLIGTGRLTSRLWQKPAAMVLGIDAPAAVGAPQQLVARATAKLAVRLAPGDSPEQAMAALAEHLCRHAPWAARVSVKPLEHVRSFLSKPGLARHAALQALREAWRVEPVEIGLGGSIALVSRLQEAMPDAEFLLTGIEDPAANIHAPNESVDLGELRRAIEAEIRMLAYLRQMYDAYEATDG
jgi:cysteinylglycine-S-conjugate dipeptidase